MKDENGKDFSSYDLDRLLSEYTELGKEKEEVRNTEPPKKKFVVHIDESLIDSQEDENSKSSSGGVYFSNYQGSHGGRSPQKGKYTEVEVKREEDVPKNGIRKKINSYTAKKLKKSAAELQRRFWLLLLFPRLFFLMSE